MAIDASRAPQRRAAPGTTPARSPAGSAGPSAREAASLTRAKSALESSGTVTPGWSSAWSPSHAPVTLIAPSAGEAIPQAAGTEEGQRSHHATARGVAQRAPRDRAAVARHSVALARAEAMADEKHEQRLEALRATLAERIAPGFLPGAVP